MNGYINRNLTFRSSGIGVGGTDTSGQIDGFGGDDLLTFYFLETVRMVSVRFGNVEGNDDNFRIRSITVEAVPLPAGAVLLLSGLGLLALRRRKS